MRSSKRINKRSALVVFLIIGLVLAACGTQVANSNWPAATAEGDVVYVAYGPGVIAVDVVEEEVLWSFPSEPNQALQFFAAPSVKDGRVVFGDYGQSGGFFSPGVTVSVYALDSETGSNPEWTQSEAASDRIIAAPLQADDKVFAGTADNHVLALDAASGRLLWEFEAEHSIWGQPSYDDGVLYITSLDKEVYALDAESGQDLWRQQLGGAVAGMASQDTDTIFVGSFDRRISALDKATGEVVWTAPAEAAVWASPVFSNGMVYYVDIDGNVYAVSAVSGEAQWSKSLDEYVTAAPQVVEDTLFVATAGDISAEPELRRGTLYALSIGSGETLWDEEADAPLHSSPVVASNGIAVVMQTSTAPLVLQVHDFDGGDELYKYEPAGEQ